MVERQSTLPRAFTSMLRVPLSVLIGSLRLSLRKSPHLMPHPRSRYNFKPWSFVLASRGTLCCRHVLACADGVAWRIKLFFPSLLLGQAEEQWGMT